MAINIDEVKLFDLICIQQEPDLKVDSQTLSLFSREKKNKKHFIMWFKLR